MQLQDRKELMMTSNKQKKWMAGLLVVLMACVSLSGCSWLDSKIHEFKGSLIGNTYTIDTFDNFGRKIMTTTGKKVNVKAITSTQQKTPRES